MARRRESLDTGLRRLANDVTVGRKRRKLEGVLDAVLERMVEDGTENEIALRALAWAR